MEDSAHAILFGFDNGQIPAPTGAVLIIGAQGAALKDHFPDATYISPFAGDHAPLVDLGTYQTVLLLAPQQKEASSYLMARGLQLLEDDGLLVVAASNDAGGRTLDKQMAAFELNSANLSKHKCRAVWASKTPTLSLEHMSYVLHMGMPQQRDDGLWTQAGVFCWDRTDKGTQQLKKHIPSNLKGHIADFGAGIGELGTDILAKNPDITSLTSIEHDRRALDCAIKNLAPLGERHKPLWADMHDVNIAGQFDYIVMNPPFHDGKSTTLSLGQTFLMKAATALKKNGTLLMVANSHLAYERLLGENFASWQEIAREGGFKIFVAKR